MEITDESPTSPAFEAAGPSSKGPSSKSRGSGPRPSSAGPSSIDGTDEPAIRYEADVEGSDDDEDVVYICKRCMTARTEDPKFCRDCGDRLVPIRADRDSYEGDTVGDKYKLVEKIGSGGMGEVYLGVNEPLDQKVAVKFLSKKYTADEQIIMRFLNEARSYCRVSHPNAVTLLDYGQHEDGALYIITEFIKGVSLTDAVEDHGPLPAQKALSVAIQICEVLSSAHREGVIHRDLKPDNIMLMPASAGRYAVKVLDFGIAKIVDDEGPALTKTGSVFGTPEFMSPEQAEGKTADARSDIYALGIILFYAATGRLPFEGESQYSVLEMQIKEAPPKASSVRTNLEVDPRVEEVIERCLQKDSDRRYETAAELLKALEETRAEIADGSVDSDLDLDVEESGAEAHTVDLTAIMEDSGSDDTRGYPAGESEIDSRADTALAARIGELDPEQGFEFSGELDSIDLSGERKKPSTLSIPTFGAAPLPLAGVAVAVAMVGALVVWQVWSSAEPQGNSSAAVESADGSASAEDARRTLSAAHAWLDEGEFDRARREVESAAAATADGERPRELSEFLAATRRRLDRAQSARRALTSAVEEGRCGEAKESGEKLVSQAVGAAPWVARKLNDCEEADEAGQPDQPESGRAARGGSDGEPDRKSREREERDESDGDGARAAAKPNDGDSDSAEEAAGAAGSPEAGGRAPGDSDGAAVAETTETQREGAEENEGSESDRPEGDSESDEPEVIEALPPSAESESGGASAEEKRPEADDESGDAVGSSSPEEADEPADGPAPAPAEADDKSADESAPEHADEAPTPAEPGTGEKSDDEGDEDGGSQEAEPSSDDEVPEGMALPPAEM